MVALADVEAKANLKRDLAFRLWSTSHGGIYLRVDEHTKPSSFLANIPERDVPTPSGGMLTLQNPASSLREIKDKQNELYGELARITGLKYLNPINAPDQWEKKALGIIDKTRQDFSEVADINGKPFLRRMQPMLMEPGCMKCHAWTGIKVGGLRGGTDIAIPLDRYQPVLEKSERALAITHAAILFIGLVTIGLISRRSRIHNAESLRYQQQLEQLARVDSLTGLLNRRHFYELAEQELIRSQRFGRPLSILMIDIDKFKKINDVHGHIGGDRVLQKLSAVFREELRGIDTICRMGGEEFAILLPETERDKAVEVAERLRAAMENTRAELEGGTAIAFTVSIGVAAPEGEKDSIDNMLRRADDALYQAKHGGRNKVCVAN